MKLKCHVCRKVCWPWQQTRIGFIKWLDQPFHFHCHLRLIAQLPNGARDLAFREVLNLETRKPGSGRPQINTDETQIKQKVSGFRPPAQRGLRPVGDSGLRLGEPYGSERFRNL